jgi:hypothetical protein
VHQPLADALGMTADPVIEPLEAALLEMRVELGEAGEGRNRHQDVAPGVADQALDHRPEADPPEGCQQS